MTFKLLTGRDPGTKPPTKIDPQLAPGWDALVSAALEPERNERLANCGAFAGLFADIDRELDEIAEKQAAEVESRRRAEALERQRRVDEARRLEQERLATARQAEQDRQQQLEAAQARRAREVEQGCLKVEAQARRETEAAKRAAQERLAEEARAAEERKRAKARKRRLAWGWAAAVTAVVLAVGWGLHVRTERAAEARRQAQESRRLAEVAAQAQQQYQAQQAEATRLKEELRRSQEAAARQQAEIAKQKEEQRLAQQAAARQQAETASRAQEATTAVRSSATTAAPEDPLSLDLGGGVKMELVWIPPGSFDMGSPDTEAGRYSDEGPVHRVTLTKGYWMGKYEVTQEQWQQVMGNNPSTFKGADLPVEQVSWNDCQAFLEKVNGRLQGGLRARLPTEAEWEYACRAGTRTRFSAGDEDSVLGAVGWYGGNSGNQTHPVGQKRANAWGLHDMHANVWEWCQDWFGNYGSGAATDPTGVSSGSARVLRGGSWSSVARYCRSAFRSRYDPSNTGSGIGFRVVVSR
jgi:formylglycine-generating enzyme required for sulfatase activity